MISFSRFLHGSGAVSSLFLLVILCVATVEIHGCRASIASAPTTAGLGNKDNIQWMRSTLLYEGAIKLSTAKVYVFSDLVLCLGGRFAEDPQSVQSWKNRIEWFTQTPRHRKLDNFNGVEWKILPGHTTLKQLRSNHIHVDVQRH